MIYVRKYGKPPYSVAVVHGGPGAPGSMAPVARELAKHCGIIEHLESATTIDGQVGELRDAMREHGSLPVTLIGHSWGAWLSLIFAARYPEMVKKLILVCSGPFEERYASQITETRLSRMSEEERHQLSTLIDALKNPERNKAALFSLYGALLSKADGYDLLPADDESYVIQFQENVYQDAWAEAQQFRRNGVLLAMAKHVRCPVVAIHGDYDPHPAEGVEKPLRATVRDFRFILLEKCGHEPWKERAAKDRFYEILIKELS
ncbi:MAG TPA: alpha/beta hydrolase [Methanocella sp.]|jgi:pimeloyl-ACP methyl ester carboxylesterase